MKILVTGSAGFIGFHACKNLIKGEHSNYNNLNKYYDQNLKKARLKILHNITKVKKDLFFFKTDISNRHKIKKIFLNLNLIKFCILLLKLV